MRNYLVRWSVLALILWFARPAIADDAKQAAAHYRQGKAYENAGQLDQAIGEYKSAYGFDNKPSHLFNIAHVYDVKGELETAIEFYDKYLAVESEGDRPKLAREAKATAQKKLSEAAERKKAEEEERKRVEEAKRVADEAAAKQRAAQNHLKQAADFVVNKQWTSAADEYKRATDADANPEHLFDAAEAYRNGRDLAAARATFEAYRDKVQVGGRSDLARKNIAELTEEIAKIQQAERDRAMATRVNPLRPPLLVDMPRRKRGISKTWLLLGGAVIAGGLVMDLSPETGKNHQLDGSDFIGAALYAIGGVFVIKGLF